jgi:hypothetical protein
VRRLPGRNVIALVDGMLSGVDSIDDINVLGAGSTRFLTTRADTWEVPPIRNRDGRANTLRGARRFVEELLAGVRREGHRGTLVILAESGLENHARMNSRDRPGVEFSGRGAPAQAHPGR